jgi:hypothetical protein
MEKTLKILPLKTYKNRDRSMSCSTTIMIEPGIVRPGVMVSIHDRNNPLKIIKKPNPLPEHR